MWSSRTKLCTIARILQSLRLDYVTSSKAEIITSTDTRSNLTKLIPQFIGNRNLKESTYHINSRGSAVGIATGYGMDDRGVGFRVPVGSGIVTSPYRPDRLWGPANLSSEYLGLFPLGYSGRGVKLTAHLPLVPRSRKRGPIHPSTPHHSSM
jgi:hypothetical protein